MSRFVIAQPEKCIGCRTCEVACVLAHSLDAGDATLSPANFKPRLKLVKTASVTAPVQCRQCENASCVSACPTQALVYERGTVQLVAERCIGCQTCVMACPFGAMEMTSTSVVSAPLGALRVRTHVMQAHKCDLCEATADGPACVRVCPTKALFLIDQEGVLTTGDERRTQAVGRMPHIGLR